MSKQQQAKAAQGYIEKPIQKMCSNCSSFDYRSTYNKAGQWTGLKPFCALGRFDTKPTSYCDKHEFKMI